MDINCRTLSADQAKDFYDRFGARQDSQAFYEDVATTELIAHAQLPHAETVLEFGCGTGRFAESLFADCLSSRCRYRGLDVSATMVRLARGRLARWGGRAIVEQTNGSTAVNAPDAAYDRFVVNYVLDLLGPADIGKLLAEAYRVLTPGGLLCTVNLTQGTSIPGKIVDVIWRALFRLNPKVVGGCRPIRIRDYLNDDQWVIRHHAAVSRYGISSEILVAMPRALAGTDDQR